MAPAGHKHLCSLELISHLLGMLSGDGFLELGQVRLLFLSNVL